jgi:predicted transport protein
MKKGELNDPKNLARDVSKIGHWGNGDYEIQIMNPEDIGYLLSLIRQSYEKN